MENIKTKTDPTRFLPHQKIGVFIDAENVEMSGYGYYGSRTDYKKLVSAIAANRLMIRLLYYKPEHKEISEDFKKFWSDMGGEIRQPVKNVDPWLIIDAVTLVDKLDVIVIVGGDKDYLPLIWYVKSRGCKAEVWTYRETCSQMIVDAADYFYAIDENYLIKDTQSKQRKQPMMKKQTMTRRPAQHERNAPRRTQEKEDNQK